MAGKTGTAEGDNGATNQGQYNGNYGSRYVQFGTTGGKAMLGLSMGYKDAAKTLKGYFGDPTNDCYRGELKPGQQVTCASAWVFDNSPSSANTIVRRCRRSRVRATVQVPPLQRAGNAAIRRGFGQAPAGVAAASGETIIGGRSGPAIDFGQTNGEMG